VGEGEIASLGKVMKENQKDNTTPTFSLDWRVSFEPIGKIVVVQEKWEKESGWRFCDFEDKQFLKQLEKCKS